MAGLTGQKYSFTDDSVANAPEGEGVYQIERSDGTIIYIGSGKIRARLQSHRRKENDADACIFRNAPTGYRREECANCKAVEQRMLSTTPTLCNQRIG